MRNIEILAPAGSYEGMKAAMNAGCDAVYIGGSSFGARAYADNAQEDILLHAIDEAHIRNKKLYLTVNTLLKEKELTGKLYSFLEKYYLQGLDAVIVQDVGVMHFIHRNFPDLPIHASTQMTLTMAQGANLLKNYGVTRLVTSRELSFSEIQKIRENTQLEIETFVHGALCYCYSGQCLMSSMIGGRSGNRGRCAQPCRMPYQFNSGNKKISTDQEKYLLSPKDINTIEYIPELVEAGIDSFKIEGRMKRPEYAAAVSEMYRKYLDLYFELGRDKYNALLTGEEYRKDRINLMDIYNRGGFSKGYGNSYNGKSMMSLQRPNHSGVPVGKVANVKGSRISIALEEKLHAQDILDIRYSNEAGYEFTVKDPHKAEEILETNIGIRRDQATKEAKSLPPIHIGDLVYRTKNNELLENIMKKYILQEKKLGIKGLLTAKQGEKLSLTVTSQEISVTVYHNMVQEAVKQPMTKEKLAASIEKTGDTLYFFEQLIIESGDNVFVPVAWLNEIRREAIEKLYEAVAGRFHRSLQETGKNPNEQKLDYHAADLLVKDTAVSKDKRQENKTSADEDDATKKDSLRYQKSYDNFEITILVKTVKQFETALQFPKITKLYVEYDHLEAGAIHEILQTAEKAGKKLYLALPHICRFPICSELEKELSEIIDNKWIGGFLIRNFEEVSLLKSLLTNKKLMKELVLNYNMYVYNKEAKEFWKENGITRYTAPVELNLQELRQLGMEDCDMVVYGHLPLMVSAQCLFRNTKGCKKSEENNSGFLTDRLGKKFFVQTNCQGCYNVIYNGQALALDRQAEDIIGLKPQNIRMDFNIETPAQMKEIIMSFVDTFCYGSKAVDSRTDYTTGHFKRGIE